ncbi:hypothetical protein JUNP479_2050 [Aeromonas jandaei]|nr:hypothetical protein JUNP479_2050 [Aeromonas jandaei]
MGLDHNQWQLRGQKSPAQAGLKETYIAIFYGPRAKGRQNQIIRNGSLRQP